MTLRYAIACLGGLGALLAAGACASASPGLDARPPLFDRAEGYELQVLVDGVPAPTFSQGGGTYVLGELGERYTLRILNHSGRRMEAVVSVDGRDVVDGRPADYRSKRGYLVPAWGQIDIDGWRLSTREAAAFRFSTVRASYAARTGSAREVGVIGAAIFPERFVPRPPRVLERPYPGPRPYPRPYSDGAPEAGGDRAAEPPPASSAEDAGQPRGGAPSASRGAPSWSRPGLGTEFGEAVSSPVEEVAFVRANPGHPATVLGVRYDDREGLMAMGVDVDLHACSGAGRCDGEAALRETATPFPVGERPWGRFAPPPPCWGDGRCRR